MSEVKEDLLKENGDLRTEEENEKDSKVPVLSLQHVGVVLDDLGNQVKMLWKDEATF